VFWYGPNNTGNRWLGQYQGSTPVFFANNCIGVGIHFAVHKSVVEPVQQPLKNISDNLQLLMNVLHLMQAGAVKLIRFSSSATVYGYHNA
jgi:UDP-glucose 4-epimerase